MSGKVKVLSLLMLIAAMGMAASGQDKPAAVKNSIPLVEREPFDRIKLDDLNGNIEIEITPPKDPPPKPLPEQGVLIFESEKLADELLQVPYANIVEYSSFNDLLRDEANQFIRDEDFGRAFRNLIYIYDHGGKQDPEIVKTIQELLFRDGAKNYVSGNFELALTIFEDIYSRDPNFRLEITNKKPIDLILDCLDRNIAAKFKAERYSQVLASVDSLEAQYGDDAAPLVNKWRERILERSNQLMQESRRLADSGDGKQAHLMARRANTVMPGRKEALELFQEILEKYPIVFVGVGDRASHPDPLSLDNWAARRTGRLTMRSVVEYVGPGDDGGRYEFLNGTMEQLDDNGLEYRFTIKDSQDEFAVPPINAYELSQRMLARGSWQNSEYNVPFARVIDTVEIENEKSVVVKLKQAHVRPEALFEFAYGASEGETAGNGPYSLLEQNEQVSIYGRNTAYPAIPGAQHPQIIEWQYPSASDAIDALIAGEIDVVDRVPPADLYRLEQDSATSIGSYIVPTVHMLVPNIRNDFTEDRSFRNGLSQGINRELILHDSICGGREINGCEVVSGPFPIGTEENDQLSYAYNLQVVPQPFNDLLGMVLTRVVYETLRSSMMKKGETEVKLEMPTLTLAHPDDEISELACSNIQQMWAAMGVQTVLRKLDDGLVVPPDDDWDFLYYQIAMEEPLINVERLFGQNGVVKSISAPAQQNMERLGFVDSWQRAGKVLRELHRQTVNDVSIIPLWQLKEHYAWRENLTNVGTNLVSLYQNVAHWHIGTDNGDP